MITFLYFTLLFLPTVYVINLHNPGKIPEPVFRMIFIFNSFLITFAIVYLFYLSFQWVIL